MLRLALWSTVVTVLAASGFVGSPQALRAQSHYWSDHFGNESILLNGAVIGSVTDAGAVFYNPARLVQQREGDLLSSAKVYEWTRTRVPNGLAGRQDLESSRLGGVPGFVVGSFTLPGLDGHQFAYGFLTRHLDRVDYTLREEDGSVLPVEPPPDLFVGFADFTNDLRDDWIGLSWAHGVSSELSFGASLFYYDLDVNRNATFDLRGVNDQGGGATLQVERSYRIRDYGLVAKAGLSWLRGTASVGVSLTLPYWSISSSGSVRYDDFTLRIPDTSGDPTSTLRSLQQSSLPVDWRTPWSLGLGAGWVSGPWQLHSALEYFAAVPAHTVLDTDPEQAVFREGAPIRYTVVDQRKAVVNVGGGVRWQGSDRVSLFASVASNLSAAPDSLVDFTALDTLVTQTTNETNFVLIGGGVSVRTPWADFTLGATWQSGRDEVGRAVLGDEPIPSAPDEPTVEFTQWRFLAGFSVPLLDDLVDEVTGRGRGGNDPPRASSRTR